MTLSDVFPEVFTVREVARAACVSTREVRRLVANGSIASLDGSFISERDAMRAIRALANGGEHKAGAGTGATAPYERRLFARLGGATRPTGVWMVLSGTLHVALIVGTVFVTAVDNTTQAASSDLTMRPVRLVYIAIPGPAGGGGGGGLRQPAPPSKAERKGQSRLDSPILARRSPKPIEPVLKPATPPKSVETTPEPPPVTAPVITAPADAEEREGVAEQTVARADSRGPGTGAGIGTGTGTGIGDGAGSGIGRGWGGGTGGGPYRPGSGVSPPRLVHEVKPEYTEEARHGGIEGVVVLGIVVRRDGSVADVRLLRGLGSGLDERAVQAVRQWLFAPALHLNVPVDVAAEVTVEFRLR